MGLPFLDMTGAIKMIQINLLPWREQARLQKKKEFGYTIVVFIVITIIFILFIHLHYSGLISNQNKRNQFLQTEVATENQTLLHLQDQVNEGKTFNDQLRFLISLRSQSYNAISLLDELTRITPEGVTFTQISWGNNAVTIFGTAVSDYQITLLMKKMSNSQILNQPELNKIDAKDDAQNNSTQFQLDATQKNESYP